MKRHSRSHRNSQRSVRDFRQFGKLLTAPQKLCHRNRRDFDNLRGSATGNSGATGVSVTTTICLINQKGGCGKSSTCFHLSGALAESGLNVLLVDMDPQGSLSQGFFGSELVEQLPVEGTVAALFSDEIFATDSNCLIRPTALRRVAVLPANHYLAPCNTPSPETSGMGQYVLREFIEALSGFDVILIDCPPNLYRCSWTSMIAADWVVVPVPPEDFGTQGLRAVHQAIGQARELNPTLRRLGHLVTRHDRRLVVHRSYEQRLRQLYGDLVLDTVIPEAAAFKVALACRQPVEACNPKSVAAKLTRSLCREILDRIAMKNGKRRVA